MNKEEMLIWHRNNIGKDSAVVEILGLDHCFLIRGRKKLIMVQALSKHVKEFIS